MYLIKCKFVNPELQSHCAESCKRNDPLLLNGFAENFLFQLWYVYVCMKGLKNLNVPLRLDTFIYLVIQKMIYQGN